MVYVVHPSLAASGKKQNDRELKREQAEFKKFLDTKGADLFKTSEILAYYALPYIPNPMQHPSFQKSFTNKWVGDLKQNLKNFIS